MRLTNKLLSAASVLMLLAAGPALAAGEGSAPAPTGMTTAGALDVTGLRALDDDDTTIRDAHGLTADDLDDMDVVNATGETIGEIDDVLVDSDNRIAAFSVEVGGFLGLGEKEVLLGADQLQLQGDRFLTTLSSEQLERQPEWND